MPGPHDFTLVSGLATLWLLWPHDVAVPLVSLVSQYTLGALGHMILHLSPTCLPCLPCLPLVSPPWVIVTLVFHLSRSLLRRAWPDDFALVSRLSQCLFRFLLFTLVSTSPACLGLLRIHLAGCFGRMILHLFSCLSLVTRVSTCLGLFRIRLAACLRA